MHEQRTELPTPETIERAVREFLDENFPLGDGLTVGRGESLQDAGVIDSVGVLELIGFLEQRYGLEISDAEVLPENLDSIAGVTQFVTAKLGEPSRP
jgi:acyl carrier protein